MSETHTASLETADSRGPVLLVIIDGWGVSEERHGNAIVQAQTPNYDSMLARHPHCLLEASGQSVGLPAGLMGNSEVGHLTMGSGRTVEQKLTRISRAIADGSFYDNAALLAAIESVKTNKRSALHLVGLTGGGCVHSHIDHLFAILELARRHGISRRTILHAILDGRDSAPDSARQFLPVLQERLGKLARLGTLCGRYYAMDRDRRWERTELFWRALVLGEGERAGSPCEALLRSYERGQTDEFVLPFVLKRRRVKDGDAVIFFNFRPDRMRQICASLTGANDGGFERRAHPVRLNTVCMSEYDPTFRLPVAFPPASLASAKARPTLSDVIAAQGHRQLHLAETEKYAHVTYFFNGGEEKPAAGEDRLLIPSLKVPTYDMAPEMRTQEICEAACRAVVSGGHRFIVLNFAAPDMVGHTGNLAAAVKAVQSVDGALGRLEEAVAHAGGVLVVTSDHGNVEKMIDPASGSPHTAHTTNPVPFIVADFRRDGRLPPDTVLEAGSLADVAPTILSIMGLPQPAEMTGRSLLPIQHQPTESEWSTHA